MKITYRREMKHNYLIIEPDDTGYESYEMHMMAANGIEGLLKFRIKQVDNQKYYYYEITSKQPLSRVLEFHGLEGKELKHLIAGIGQILRRLEIYLLQENQILLSPDYIYVHPEQFKVFLCLIPGRQGQFSEEMTGLLRYLLGKINHQDKESVVMAYGLYQESLKENYGMNDLLEIIGNNESPMDEKEYERENSLTADSTFSIDNKTEEVEICGEEKKVITKLSYIRPIIITSCLMIFTVGIALWVFFGVKGIWKFWYVIAGAGILGVILIGPGWGRTSKGDKKLVYNHDKEKNQHRQEEIQEWNMAFEDEIEKVQEKPLQTVLLTDPTEQKGVPCLRSIEKGMEDIPISYVPFLIGKQKGLVDCVINREAVSRIHARIDKEGEVYRISDLNSTNGTFLNGRLLETNETAALKIGDEVFIANFAFIFT